MSNHSESTASGTNTEGNANRFSRSRQMVDALRQEFVYSEKRARDILFGEIEAVLQQHGPSPIVSRLTREAAARGRQRAQQIGYELSNWETAAKTTIQAMLGAGVLLTRDGQSIPFTIAAQATEVVGLADNYRDITEAYLLEFLIRKLGDVTTRDHTALAHALFRQFDRNIPMGDLEDRVAVLLARLSDRIRLAERGVYYVLGSLSYAAAR